VGDPENVIEFLWMARVRVIGAFVFVLDLGTTRLALPSSFFPVAWAVPPSMGQLAVLWISGVGEKRMEEQAQPLQLKEQQAKNLLTHLVLQTGISYEPD